MNNSGGIKRPRGSVHSPQDAAGPAPKRCKAWDGAHRVLDARAFARAEQDAYHGLARNEVSEVGPWDDFSLALVLAQPKTEPAARPHRELPLGDHHVWSPHARELRTLAGEAVSLNEFSINLVEALVQVNGGRLPKKVLAKKAGFPARHLAPYLLALRKVVPDVVHYNLDGYRIAMRPADMEGPVVARGPLNLHLDQRTVARGSDSVGLRAAEFFILQSLLESKEKELLPERDLLKRMRRKSAEIPRKTNVLSIFDGMATKLARLVTLNSSKSGKTMCYSYSHVET